MWFLALLCVYFMQARVDWVLMIFGTQVIKKKRPVLSGFLDYLSVSYDYAWTEKSKHFCMVISTWQLLAVLYQHILT